MAKTIIIVTPDTQLFSSYLSELKEEYKIHLLANGINLKENLKTISPQLCIVHFSTTINKDLAAFTDGNGKRHCHFPLLLTTANLPKEHNLGSFTAIFDDILSFPIPVSNFVHKIKSWFQLANMRYNNISHYDGNKLLFEDCLDRVREFLRHGNFGLAHMVLEKIKHVVATFPEKATEIEAISMASEAVLDFISEKYTLPLLLQVNTIDLTTFSTSKWHKAVDEVTTTGEDLGEISREGLTKRMDMDEFIQVKESSSLTVIPNIDSQDNESSIDEQALISEQLKLRTSDAKFARKLVKRRMISKQQLIGSLKEQKEMEKQGQNIPLCNVMLINKVILPQDIQRVFGPRAITSFYCRPCAKTYRVLNLDHQPPESFHCRICHAQLTIPPESDELFVFLEEVKKKPEEKKQDLNVPIPITKKNIPKLIERARILSKKKELERALSLYEQILELDPTKEECRIGRSRLFVENKAYSKAIEEANEVLANNPNHYQALCHRGVAQYYLGDIDSCIKDMSVLIEQQIHNFMSYSTRGKAHYRKKNYQQAIQDLTESIIRSPDFVKGYIYRGKAYLHLKKNKLAVQDFEEALKINKDYPNADEIKKLIIIARERDREE